MIKKILVKILTCIILCMVCINTVYADTVTLYANLDDSSNTVNLLVDCMYNDDKYDPYNQYCVVRAGEFDYRVYFGHDLSKTGDIVYYKYTPAQYQTPASITRGTTDNLQLRKNGYYFVGNIDGALSSDQAERYKTGAIITTAAIIILFVILFGRFRKSEGKNTKYYSVR